MKSLFPLLIMILTSCPLWMGAQTCIEKIIAADSELGAIRNHACEKIALSTTISKYVAGVKKLDYSNCPAAFVSAFNRHQQAWLDMIRVTDKYPELRGEMHDLFDIIENASDAEIFKISLKAIMDTWAEVETAMK